MSSISGVSGASNAWSDMSAARTRMKEKMFAKADTDGNGSIDKNELQGALDRLAARTGKSEGSSDDLFAKFDTDGNGSLSADELDAGMKSLMPQRPSAPGPAPSAPAQTGAASGQDSSDLLTIAELALKAYLQATTADAQAGASGAGAATATGTSSTSGAAASIDASA